MVSYPDLKSVIFRKEDNTYLYNFTRGNESETIDSFVETARGDNNFDFFDAIVLSYYMLKKINYNIDLDQVRKIRGSVRTAYREFIRYQDPSGRNKITLADEILPEINRYINNKFSP